jgi:hypothetical protein
MHAIAYVFIYVYILASQTLMSPRRKSVKRAKTPIHAIMAQRKRTPHKHVSHEDAYAHVCVLYAEYVMTMHYKCVYVQALSSVSVNTKKTPSGKSYGRVPVKLQPKSITKTTASRVQPSQSAMKTTYTPSKSSKHSMTRIIDLQKSGGKARRVARRL